METLANVFKHAGIPIYLNVIVSAVVIATIVDRTIALMGQYRIKTETFVQGIMKLLQGGNLDRAIKYCQTTKAAIAKVCFSGLSKADRSNQEISMAIEEELMHATPTLEKRISNLWSLANIATLIGLIGTIFGLIRCFSGLAAVSPEQKATYLSIGIAEALNNTAIGLGIAIVCMIGHLALSGVSKKLVADMEAGSMSLENFLILRKRESK